MKKIAVFAAFVLYLFIQPVQASSAPDAIIRDVTDRLVAELNTNRDALVQDKSRLYAMVDEVVLPVFSFEKMSMLVLGRYWKQAKPEQQQQFVEEFRNLLVRTYASAIYEYTGEESLEIKPAEVTEGDNKTQVHSEFRFSNGSPPIPVNYAFIKEKSGDWKVYDVNIDGISLVTNYRTSYGQIIQQQGIDGLIESLAKKNAEYGQ